MPSQLLVNVITATVPASAVNYAVAHGLRSNDKAVAPTLVLPQSQTAGSVTSADETNVYLTNASAAPAIVTLRCERDLSMQADAASVTPFYMSTGPAVDGVASVGVTYPITNTGTATNPVIGFGGPTMTRYGAAGPLSQTGVVLLNDLSPTLSVVAPDAGFIYWQYEASEFTLQNTGPNTATVLVQLLFTSSVTGLVFETISRSYTIPAGGWVNVPDGFEISSTSNYGTMNPIQLRLTRTTGTGPINYSVGRLRLNVYTGVS